MVKPIPQLIGDENAENLRKPLHFVWLTTPRKIPVRD
jgi:hypothetical protein